MAKRGNRVQVILECTEHKASVRMAGASCRHITTKNKKNTPDRVRNKKIQSDPERK